MFWVPILSFGILVVFAQRTVFPCNYAKSFVEVHKVATNPMSPCHGLVNATYECECVVKSRMIGPESCYPMAKIPKPMKSRGCMDLGHYMSNHSGHVVFELLGS